MAAAALWRRTSPAHSEGFHLSAEVANAAAAELAKLRQRGEQNAVEAVPDGVVPSALAAFLSAVGVSDSELALRLADVIVTSSPNSARERTGQNSLECERWHIG